MIRRMMLTTMLLVLVAAPHIGTALPREGMTQTAPEQLVTWPGGAQSATLQANDSVGLETPTLQNNRVYRFEVTGTWKPTTSATNFADAAFETTNGTNWSKTGRGMVVRATNMGDPNKPPSQYRSDHKYSLSYLGRGSTEVVRLNDPQGFQDNTGSLTVKIWVQQIVVWQLKVVHPLPDGSVPPTQETSIPLSEVPTTITVVDEPIRSPQDIGIPNLGLPELARAELTFRPGPEEGEYCITLKLAVPGVPLVLPLGCSSLYGGFTDQSYVVGGDANNQPFVRKDQELVPKTEYRNTPKDFLDCLDGDAMYNVVDALSPPAENRNACNDKLVIVPQQPGQPLLAQLPPGSSLDLTVSWRADQTKLWFTPLNDEQGTALVMPFNPISGTDRTWFLSQATNLYLNLDIVLRGPGGGALQRVPTISVPAAGQLMEALFTSSVGGI